ncbi:MAG: hypothetical protein ABIO24_14180 [Saprospiraceae bacterium]
MDCPNCGQTARPESTRCGHCNFKLPKTQRPVAGPASTTLVACWNCAQPNASETDRCTHCNAKTKGVVAKPAAATRISSISHAENHG